MICVFSRSALKATGPVSADHLADLQRQRQRLISAVRRMAVVISELQADKAAGSEKQLPLPDATHRPCHAQGEDVDITEVLNQYAPEPGPWSDEGHGTPPHSLQKRRRPDVALTDTGVPEVHDLQDRVDESVESSTYDTMPNSMNIATTRVRDRVTPAVTSYVPFMRMLQNLNVPNPIANGADAYSPPVTGSAALKRQPVFDSPIGLPPAENTDVALTTSHAVPDGPWDASMAPLLEMVDWDASLLSCWDFYGDEQKPALGGSFTNEAMPAGFYQILQHFRLASVSREDLLREDEDKSAKAKGNQPDREIKSAALRVYTYYSIGDTLTSSEVVAQADEAHVSDAALISDKSTPTISVHDASASASGVNTTQVPRGFDCLLSAGFALAEVANFSYPNSAPSKPTPTPRIPCRSAPSSSRMKNAGWIAGPAALQRVAAPERSQDASVARTRVDWSLCCTKISSVSLGRSGQWGS
ncbi:hypothetical protein LTR02_015771 [Friedmanniomyces endolithicus]|nr:hypothetical protein LTR03_016515 [Friedmanniomyces endolithicus]KAK0845558.1 hypothetical protein LTS02_015261 [Friedmanniomyces endolithicus]KAK0889056.1 hypothetical protein LTR02_015771 [Friedmanniomyces endolithicus]